MALEVFHKFGELVPELRILIWEMTVRDMRPGIHIFEADMRPSGDDQHGDLAPQIPGEITIFGASKKGKQAILVHSDFITRGPFSVRFSYPVPNISTYLENSSLWTACKESQMVMSEQVQKPWRYYQCCGYRFDDGPLNFQTPTGRSFPGRTGSFTNKDGELQFFTVFPRDLVVIQPRDLETFLPHKFQLYSVEHVALEYDRAWEADEHRATRQKLAAVAVNLRNLWLIDWTLERDASLLGRPTVGRIAFHWGKVKLVETWQEDLCEEKYKDQPAPKIYDVIAEIWQLMHAQHRANWESGPDEAFGTRHAMPCFENNIGVLSFSH